MENVYVFDITNICTHGKELLWTILHSIKNTGEKFSQWRQMLDISEQVDSRTIRWDLWSDSQLSWERFCMETVYVWLVMKKSSVSRMQKVYVFSDSVLCLMDRWIRALDIKYWLVTVNWNGSNGIFITIQDFGHTLTENRCNSKSKSFLSVKSESSWANMGEPEEFHRTDHLHVDVQRHHHRRSKDNETGIRIAKRQTRFDLCAERCSTKNDGHSSDLDQKRSGILLMKDKPSRRMGQSRRADDDKNRRKRTPSLPIHESIVPKNAQKQRWWKIINTLLCADEVIRLKLFFAQLLLLISSVFTEQSKICVKNAVSCRC